MEGLDLFLQWVRGNLSWSLVVATVAFGLLLLRRYAKLDQAERVFRRARLRVPVARINQLREEYIQVAFETERKRLADDARQQTELEAIQREKTRILGMVRSTPQVVKEVGEALQAIEREYERNLRSVKSEQAREGLRLTAQRQVQEVLKSVTSDQTKLPPFEIHLDSGSGHHSVRANGTQPDSLKINSADSR